MEDATPHELLFERLARLGYPVTFQGYNIMYDVRHYQVDLMGFDCNTTLKIQVMRSLLNGY